MKRCSLLLLFVPLMLVLACERDDAIDPLRRATVDGLNKEAFINRYRDPHLCLDFARQALDYINDSLPHYSDGRLRAYNTMAFAYYQLSERTEADAMLAQVEKLVRQQPQGMHNGDIEWVIAQLIKARLLQRDCRIADSYRLLYEIERSRVLARSRDNLLYNYAQSEYYITSLVLNFHYREGKVADVRQLLTEVEARRDELQVDYAQDMALNYALAHAWQSAGETVTAIHYCDRTLDILEFNPAAFCTFHYANTLQMLAMALRSLPGETPPDSVLALYDQARELFFDYGDPYQMLGGTVSTARYALLIGDTAFAHQVLSQWRAMRGTWQPFAAPKMELSYFDVLLRSRMAESADVARGWYEHYAELRERIDQYEKEDFALQETLASATRRAKWLTRTTMAVSLLLLLLLCSTLLLWRNSRRLRREKRQLEQAKRRDVERIANVETCLSVLRHDVSPFIGYLNSPTLSPELREEVTSQLVRTFENIKHWTNLSIPTGLVFNAQRFPLQQVMDDVRVQVMRPRAGVSLHFAPTTLYLYADPLLVTILLRNLVTNALQHTDSGRIEVSAQQEADGMATISIADTGSGMPAAQLESLFRADRQVQGEHGFGLILCRYIIKKHDDLTRRGCRIWAESVEGQGTTMKVRLATEK